MTRRLGAICARGELETRKFIWHLHNLSNPSKHTIRVELVWQGLSLTIDVGVFSLLCFLSSSMFAFARGSGIDWKKVHVFIEL